MLSLLVAAFAWPGQAEACPITNPSCTIENAQRTVDDTVTRVKDTAGDVTDTADETVHKVEETAGNTVDEVKETTGKVTDTIDKTTDQVINPTDPTTPTTPTVNPDKPGQPNKGPGNAGPRDRVKGHQRTRPDGRDRRSSDGPLNGLRDPRLATNFSREPGTVAVTDTSVSMPRRPLESLGRAAVEALKKFAFPLLMTLAVGAFLLVQSRIDRRDPKLAFAPVDYDMLGFE
ncbi:MAG: hypothetical protein M3285_13250 [Actinomycetota bacterium]|nr:hypothetical protein [Actinomycetota bacterium]